MGLLFFSTSATEKLTNTLPRLTSWSAAMISCLPASFNKYPDAPFSCIFRITLGWSEVLRPITSTAGYCSLISRHSTRRIISGCTRLRKVIISSGVRALPIHSMSFSSCRRARIPSMITWWSSRINTFIIPQYLVILYSPMCPFRTPFWYRLSH